MGNSLSMCGLGASNSDYDVQLVRASFVVDLLDSTNIVWTLWLT